MDLPWYGFWKRFCNCYTITSGFWPRVRARALRAPVFLGPLPRLTGRCAPRPSQLRYSPPTKKSTISRNKMLPFWPPGSVYFSTGLRCTPLSYIASYWVTLHPFEFRCTLLSYAAPYWATLHPTMLCCIQLSYLCRTQSELSCILLSYAAPRGETHSLSEEGVGGNQFRRWGIHSGILQ